MLLALLFSSCDEQREATYPSEEEIYEDFFEEETVEEFNGDVEEETPFEVDLEEYIYEDEAEYEESNLAPPAPELTTVTPAGDVIEDAKWDEITEGVSYERTEEEKPEERSDFNPGFNFGNGFAKGMSTVAWVLVIALIVGFIVWLIVRTKVDTSVDKVRDFTLTDELLAASKEELADALTQNLNRKDYQAAIRYRFGQLLQAMRKEGLLVWVPGRTNAEYQGGLKAPFFRPFGVLAKAFSYALYSGREVTLDHYESFAIDTDAFLALLSPLSPKPNQR